MTLAELPAALVAAGIPEIDLFQVSMFAAEVDYVLINNKCAAVATAEWTFSAATKLEHTEIQIGDLHVSSCRHPSALFPSAVVVSAPGGAS